MRKKTLLAALFGLGLTYLTGQTNKMRYPTDTIHIEKEFLKNSYLLHGKRMNLHVMKWFMADDPESHLEIKLAMLCDQISIVGYSIGGLFFLTGVFANERNKDLADNLYVLGGASVGGGILFQILTGVFKKNAARIYNRNIRNRRQVRGVRWKVGIGRDGVMIGMVF